MHRLLVCGIFCLLSCGSLPIPEPGEAFEPFVGDFESGNFDEWYLLVPDTSKSFAFVNEPVRGGNRALRVTLDPDDFAYNGYRAELAVYHRAKYRTEVFYAFSVWIDSNYTDDQYNVLAQWQDLPDYAAGESWDQWPVLVASSPPLALILVEGRLEIKVNRTAGSNKHTFVLGEAVPVQKNQWIDVACRVFWSDDSKGWIEARINGEYVTPFNGKDHKIHGKNLFNRAGNYFKIGQYRGQTPTKSTNTVYFDEVRVGHSWDEVMP